MKLFASSLTALSLIVFVSVYMQNNCETVFGQQQVKLTAIVAEPKERWDMLFEKVFRQVEAKPSRTGYPDRPSCAAI